MRRAASLVTGFVLVQGLCLAPFQHVHADHDHDHSPLVHAHFYAPVHHQAESGGPQFDDIDDHSSVRSLDTFTLAFASNQIPIVLPRGPVVEPASIVQYQPVETVEACAHDPPVVDRSIPRAPPS